jgi:hypothetical protein
MPQSGLTDIGKYRIIELIGEGSMGVVYRAFDPVLARPVAIKVMTDALAREPELRDRFVREAQAAGSLQHPNIITIYDFGEVDAHPFIAMEYVEGQAKIMDFGIAQLASSSLTKTGVMLGTPNYMAPEQVVGERTSPATDIFAFGAVLFELLTGHRPFQGPTLHNVFFKIVSEDVPSLQLYLPGLPPALDRIVRRALAKDPRDRYPSALEMANELSAVRAALSGDPRGSTLSLRASIASAMRSRGTTGRVRPRVWRAWLAAGGVLVVLGVVVGIEHWGRVRSAVAPAIVDTVGGRRRIVAPVTAESLRAPAVAESVAGSVRGRVSEPPRRPQRAAMPEAPRAVPGASVAGRDSSALRSVLALRASALRARQRAVAAGAPVAALERGDTVSAPADTLIARGGLAGAAERLATASALWLDAEREARSPSPPVLPRAEQRSGAAPPTTGPPSAPPRPRAPPPELAPNPGAEIAGIIADYARAISSRDIAHVRRAYPGMTAEQERGFVQFFQSVRSLRAELSVSGLELVGAAAGARVVGVYEFVGHDGTLQRQPIAFQARLEEIGGRWQLVAVQ